jgi:hypothetical protein
MSLIKGSQLTQKSNELPCEPPLDAAQSAIKTHIENAVKLCNDHYFQQAGEFVDHDDSTDNEEYGVIQYADGGENVSQTCYIEWQKPILMTESLAVANHKQF